MSKPLDLSDVVVHFSFPLATSTTTTASMPTSSIFLEPPVPHDGIHPPHQIVMVPAPSTAQFEFNESIGPNTLVLVARPHPTPEFTQPQPHGHPVLLLEVVVVLLAIWGTLAAASAMAWVAARQWLAAITHAHG